MAGMRYGRHVEGAGVHHNPTPGPADGEWMYGHNGVSLCFLAAHPLWGVIALPLRSMLYVRVVDIPAIAEKHGWEFRTKYQLAVELVSWFVITARPIGLTCKIRLVAEGGYAARPLIELCANTKRFSQPPGCQAALFEFYSCASMVAVGLLTFALTPKYPLVTSWKQLPRGARSKNISMTLRRFGVQANNKSATYGRTSVAGISISGCIRSSNCAHGTLLNKT